MLFDYTAADVPPGRAGTVWSRFPLQPLAPGALTPFSYSVLAEIAGRAWYVYYDRLGFDPTPRAKVVRRQQGHLYFNLSLGAQLEADHAGVEPLSLQVNGQPYALATWEKPGFLAGFKVGRAQKRIDDTLAEMARDMAATTEKARTWYLKTQAIKRWGQAEVLQIMEEIERVGVESMAAFLAARLNLAQHMARLVAGLCSNMTVAQAVSMISGALCDLSGLVEQEMIAALAPLVEAARIPDQHALLQRADTATWHQASAGQELNNELRTQIKTYLDAYGHRALGEGEIANARWAQDASLLYSALMAQIEQPLAPRNKTNQQSALLNALPASVRKQGEQSLKQLGELLKLQSRALHAIAYIWAGTRSWALASAGEAMVDKRLHSLDEVFLFELEEIKQMMTGEWNVSSREEIRAMVAQRQQEYAAIRTEVAADALIGDTPALFTHQGLPGVVGQATGPLAHWGDAASSRERDGEQGGEQGGEDGAIVATSYLDSGYTLALPKVAGFVAASGLPCDPFVVAAQTWARPVAVNLGQRYAELSRHNGTPTTLAVDENGVTISHTPA